MTREEFQKILPALVKNYQPGADVLQRIGRINVLMVVGPSGAGKTTLIQRLPFKYVLSDNTRPARSGEQEGIDFYFRQDLDEVVKEIKNGRFVQVAVDSGGDLKATKASSYPESGDVVMAVVADVIPIFRKLGFKSTKTAFITPPSYEEWMRRINNHKLSQPEFEKRMQEARRSFSFALTDNQTAFILCDEVSLATTQLQNLLANHHNQSRENAAKTIAAEILNKIS